jgi:DNA-binding response OmpR family regulator
LPEDRQKSPESSVGPPNRSTVVLVTAERILIVEDDERIGTSLDRALGGSGYITEWVTTGHAALHAATTQVPQLVLLDIGLPDIDGLEVCRSLHSAHPRLDVIMLTARDDELDIVAGLDAGAVDYITKPFRLSELLARIRAQLRRTEPRSITTFVAGDLTLDPGSRRVHLVGVEIELRPKEFDLLARLVADAGRVLSRDTLMSDIWDEHWFGSTKTLDFHIAALRQKLDAPNKPSRITTIRGIGFRYELA